MDNKKNLTHFFQSEQSKMTNFVRKNLKGSGVRDAEDVVQDVMLSVFDNLDPFSPIENIAGYVYRAIRNRIIDLYRKRKNRDIHFEDIVDEYSGHNLTDILADTNFDTHTEIEKIEIMDRIVKAIEYLKPNQKAIWVATEMDGFTFEELALAWGVPIGTLLTRKHRAVLILRKKLRDLIEE